MQVVTALFVPGSRSDRFDKAFAAGTDAVVIDLEDAVAAHDRRAARTAVETWLIENGARAARTLVRINGEDSEDFSGDLVLIERLSAYGLGGVLVPKVESAEVLTVVAKHVDPATRILAIIESALGVQRLAQIASAERVERLAFGAADYTADVGCALSEQALLFARSAIVTASAAAGLLPPWDSPCFSTEDVALIRRHGEHGHELGFGGALCIHPVQIPHIAAMYAPSQEQVAWARRIVTASAATGASRVGSEMVDAPVRQRAQRILDAHDSYGARKERHSR